MKKRSVGWPWAEIRGMQIRELVAALISAIIEKDLLQLVLQRHSVEQQEADCVRERMRLAEHCDEMG